MRSSVERQKFTKKTNKFISALVNFKSKFFLAVTPFGDTPYCMYWYKPGFKKDS